MHLESLKIFCDVVAQRSFSRAARANGISQSGVSQVVRQLEERLGSRLVDRSKRPFVLTREGNTFYQGCRRIVQSYFDLEEQVRTLHDEIAGRVVVSSIYSVGLHHMSRYMQEFLTSYPRANIRLQYLHPQRVYESVEKDEADLGLISYPRASRALEIVPWRNEPMVLVCAPDHELAGAESLPLEALHGLDMVPFESGLAIRREIDRALQMHRVETKVTMEFDNIETIKRAVEIGAGVSLLPEPTVAREVEAGTLVSIPLSDETLVRPLAIVYRRGRTLSLTSKRFIDLLTSKELEPDSALTDTHHAYREEDEPNEGSENAASRESDLATVAAVDVARN